MPIVSLIRRTIPWSALVAGVLLAGCSSSVIVESKFPSPLVEALPVRMGILIPEELYNYIYTEEIPNQSLWTIALGDANVAMLEPLFAKMFRETRNVNALPVAGDGTVDGVLCWDLIDYLDKASALAVATELTRVLRPDGALLGFFGTVQSPEARYTKYIIADEINLKHRSYPAARGRQSVLLNRDIIKMFGGLRVSDSFLLKNNIREILFRKPA